MLTLQELKKITAIPEQGVKTPTAKRLRGTGEAVAEKKLGKGAWIVAYQNGYALYHVGGHSTVFSIHICGSYLYESNGVGSYLSRQLFEKEPWYIRLILEGEDRLERNQRVKEQEKAVSYSAISEEWKVMENLEENPLKHLVERENMKEMLHCLTNRQRMAVNLCFFQQRTQKEVARELGITSQAVSIILLQAARRLQKKYSPKDQVEKVVITV